MDLFNYVFLLHPSPFGAKTAEVWEPIVVFFNSTSSISSRKSPFHFVMERVPRRWSQRAPDVWFVSPSRAPFCRVSRSICNMSGVIGNMQHAAEGSRSRSYESINTKVCKSYLKGKTAFKVKYLGLDGGLALVSISYLSKLSDCCVFLVMSKPIYI